MRKFESNVQLIKYKVNKEVCKRFLAGEDSENNLDEIAKTIIPGPTPITRCCIYKERAIIRERSKYVLNASQLENEINILDIACDECPIDRFTVTEACRGCLAHKCQESCPKDAIMIVHQRAYINQNICIECGKCAEACPFNAISDVERPCRRSCPINAIQINGDKKAKINYDKCVSCGSCVYQCPFGAINDKNYLLDVLRLLKDSNHNENYKVYALVAPAIASQFSGVKIGQVITSIQKTGFHQTLEVALGADMTSLHEASEFAETIEKRNWMTTSCCPAFVSYIQKHAPELMEHVSTTVSPMIAIGRWIKSIDSAAKIVFIGPCTAKKAEIRQNDLRGVIDYVITFEELRALLDAMDIDVTQCVESNLDTASYFGRIFARSGGVTDAVAQALAEEGLNTEFNPVKCDGLSECITNLRIAKANRLKGNFIEGMACKFGCIGGAASLSHGPKDVTAVDKYGKLSAETTIKDALKTFSTQEINMERDYGLID